MHFLVWYFLTFIIFTLWKGFCSDFLVRKKTIPVLCVQKKLCYLLLFFNVTSFKLKGVKSLQPVWVFTLCLWVYLWVRLHWTHHRGWRCSCPLQTQSPAALCILLQRFCSCPPQLPRPQNFTSAYLHSFLQQFGLSKYWPWISASVSLLSLFIMPHSISY